MKSNASMTSLPECLSEFPPLLPSLIASGTVRRHSLRNTSHFHSAFRDLVSSLFSANAVSETPSGHSSRKQAIGRPTIACFYRIGGGFPVRSTRCHWLCPAPHSPLCTMPVPDQWHKALTFSPLVAHTMRASRNIYKDEVDFTALALQSPEFAK